MTYTRKWELQASHFNDEAYPLWREAQEAVKAGEWERAYDRLLGAAKQTHGHNFQIVAQFEMDDGKMGDRPWIVDDFLLQDLMASFNGNLSLDARLLETNRRATTENLAKLICETFREAAPGCAIYVQVHETAQICAQYFVQA